LYSYYQQNKLNTDTTNNAAGWNNNKVGQQRVPTYECPSDDHLGLLEDPASGPGSGQPWMHGSYRANSGKSNDLPAAGGPPYRGFWDTFEPQYWPNNTLNPKYKGPLHGTGAAYNGVPAQNGGNNGGVATQMGGPERFQSIRDGLSNTFMVGEFTLDQANTKDGSGENRGTFWAYTYASYNQSSFSTLQATFTTDFNACYDTYAGQAWTDQACKRGWGSNHTNGVNFLMCDGSVRWVTYGSDINIMAAMATIAGGEVAELKDE
jgi:prepilin-type processing-associated H-X9-DG protein